MEAEAAKLIGAGIACVALLVLVLALELFLVIIWQVLCATRQRHKASSRTASGLAWQRQQRFFRSDYCPYFTVCGLSRTHGDLLVLEALGVNHAAA
ncbi:MAG: hypothetical protein CM15mP55_0190 [Hyphomicrobiales bacterium]|nr:MAG: hypothetical protein CM15mP55_0190 [Hyphomicrobiales bacterium]